MTHFQSENQTVKCSSALGNRLGTQAPVYTQEEAPRFYSRVVGGKRAVFTERLAFCASYTFN